MLITAYKSGRSAWTFAHSIVLVTGCIAALLSGCGGGSNSPGASTVVIPPTVDNAVTPDLRQAHLLTDAELKSPLIAAASGLSPPTADEQAWLAQHHHPIRSIVYDQDFSDLAFLAGELNGKRIVQLGESSHGSAEFSAMKVRLIKYLHESLGFNVLAMESSLSGCHVQDLALAMTAPTPNQGIECTFSVWNTQDLNELARYLFATRQTAHPLRLTGFDIQTSSSRLDSNNSILNWISPLLDRRAPDLTAPTRAAIVDAATNMQLIYGCGGAQQTSCPAFDNHRDATLQSLDALAAQLRARVDAMPAADPDRQEMVFTWLTVESLHDRLVYQRGYLSDPYGWAALRDPMMATNITRLADLAYPTDKIIVWAHNDHVENHYPDSEGHAPMGSYLRTQWGDQLSSIGLFMLRGVSANNLRAPDPVKPPMPNSLEAYAYSLHLGAVYLPVPRVDATGSGDDWLHRLLNYYQWGHNLDNDVLADNFDGVIVIDRSSMPHYNP